MSKNKKPDYTWWSKADNWSLKEATLLLHSIEPSDYSSLRLAERDIPPELKLAQRTYNLLRSIPWKERYAYHIGKGLCPLAVVTEAANKELPLPKQLYESVSTRFEQIKNTVTKNTTANKLSKDNEQTSSTRERRTFLKAIGILVKLLLDSNLSKKMCSQGQKPSASQIKQLILETADQLGMEELDGLKSIDRKITEALELVAEESQQTIT